MANIDLARDILRAIDPLFKKKRNVFYEVRLVMQPFSHKLNVFFEWGNIGHATISRQIKSAPDISEEEAFHLKKTLERQLGIAVDLVV